MKIKNKVGQQKIRITGLFFIAMLIMLPGFSNAQKDTTADESGQEAEIIKFNTPKEAFASYTASNATVAVKKAVVEYLQNETKAQNEADARTATKQLISLYTRETNTTDLIQLCSQRLNVEKDTKTIYSLTITLTGAYQTAQDYSNAVRILNGFLERQRTKTSPANVLKTASSLSTLYVTKTGQTNEALAMLERELKQLPPDAEKERSGMVKLIVGAFSRSRANDKIIEFCASQMEAEKSPLVLYTLATGLSKGYQGLQDYTNSAKVLDTFLEKNRATASPAHVSSAAKTLSGLYVEKFSRPDLAVAMWDRELKALPVDAEKERSGMVNLIVGAFSRSRVHDKIIEFCASQMEAEKSPLVLYTLATGLSKGYQGLQDYTNSAKVLDTFLEKNRATSLPAKVLTASKTLSGLYVGKLSRPDLAVAMWDRELKALPTDADHEKASMLIAKGDIYFLTLDDMASAEAAYQKAAEFDRIIPASSAISGAYLKLAQVHAKIGSPDQAGAVLLTCLTNCPTLPATPLVQKMIEVDAPNPCLDSAVWILRDRIATQYAASASVDRFQPDIVKLLLKQGKNQEALQETRIFLHACSDRSLPAAINLVTMAFKTIDINLGRANNFLRYQKYGVAGEDGKSDTADDLKNPLLDAPALNNERRNALFMAKLDTLPNNWTGWRNRASIYIYLDQPDEVFQALRKSFEMCPMKKRDIQSATDALTGFIIRNTKDVKLAESLVDYIMLGQMGKDGKSGTADDLKDPAQDIAHQIRYVQRSAAPESKPAEQPVATQSSTSTPPDDG